MRAALLTLFTLALAAPALAQQPAGQPRPAVVGTVVSGADGQPLPGATVAIRLPADSSLVTGAAADGTGRFVLRSVPNGNYLLEASFVGYVTLRQALTYAGQPVNVGALRLAEDARTLGAVNVQGQAIVADQRADTLVFDARQFQVNRDATAEDLVRRIPGATVQDGQVQIGGENVARVTLDGRDLFGGDATTALRNLPAEVVSQVETFEGRTDASSFSGFDDGERVRTVNLVSRADFRNTGFGRAYGGYGGASQTGVAQLYQAGFSANLLQRTRRLNIVAQSNNVNQQNFGVEDLIGLSGGGGGAGRMMMMRGGGGGAGRMMFGGGGFGGFGGGGDFGVPQQNGISTTHALGVNYSDRLSRQTELTGSYFFNATDNTLRQLLDQQFVANELGGQRYDEATLGDTRNASHRANARLNVNFSPQTALQVRPRLSTQLRRSTSAVTGEAQNDAGPLSETQNVETARNLALSFTNEALFRHRFDAARRTVSLGLTTTYNDRDRQTTLESLTNTFGAGAGTILIDQTGDIGSNGLGFTLTGTVSQSFGERHAALLTASAGQQETDSDRLYFDLLTGVPVADSTLSTRLQSGLSTYRAGTGYRYRSDTFTLTSTLDVQAARQSRAQTFPVTSDRARTFYALLPTLTARYNWSRTRNVNLNLRATQNTPSIEQLDDAIDVSNALRLTRGNPALRPETRVSGGLRFLDTQFQQGRTFIVGLNGDYSFGFIGSSTTIATRPVEIAPDITLPSGGQLQVSENLDGRYALRLFSSVGRPIRPLRSNVNATVFTAHTRTPSLLNGELRATQNTFVGPGLSLTSNISPQVDFTLGTNSAITFARSNVGSGQDQRYLTQTSRASFNAELPWGTTLRTDAVHQTYAGLEDANARPYMLWNASIGQRFLRGGPAELRLQVTDILNQNESYNRTVSDLYVQGVQANTLRRYAQLVFSYTVRPTTGGAGGGMPSFGPRGRP